jgi:hypothetical protein
MLFATVVLSTTIWSACNKGTDSTMPAKADAGKVPVTTKSEEARKEFVEGRALAEKLLAQESLQHFDKAIALDSDFASAELARANSSPTAKEFFEHLNKAVALADKSSEGEKLVILANQAGVNGDVAKQKAYLDQLVGQRFKTTSVPISTWADITSDSKNLRPLLSTSRKPQRLRPTTRRHTTCSDMHIASKPITQTPSKLSRNTSASFRTILTPTILTQSFC